MPAPAFLGAAARVLGTAAVGGLAGFQGRGREYIRKRAEDETEEGMLGVAYGAAKAGLALGALGGLAPAVIRITQVLSDFAQKIIQRQRQFDFLSPSIASAFARLDYNTLRNQYRTAAGTTGTTNTLANALMRMQDAQQPIDQATKNIENVLATFAAKLATAIMAAANRGGLTGKLEEIAQALDWAARGGLKNPTLNTEDYRQFFREMQRGNFGKPFNQTPGKDGRF